MTESAGNEPGSALFARIQQMVNERGVDIRLTLSGHALRLEFANGQRILVNFDAQTHNVWLAARSGGIEFVQNDDSWRAHDGSEFFASLHAIMEQTIASDPLNARPPAAQIPQTPRPEPVAFYEARETHGLRNLLLVVLTILTVFWAAQKLSAPPPEASTQAQTISLSSIDAQQPCEGGFPANGTIALFPEGGLHAAGPNDPEVTLQNDHAHPVLLILTAPQSVIPLMSVLVHARQATSLRLPAGQYGMLFAVGSTWCNPRQGFSDGRMLKFDQPLLVQMERTLQLTMQSSGAGMADFQLFVKAEAPEAPTPAPTFSGDGSMEVQRHSNGHFYVPGSVENVPVTFMVDTGATVTSISSELAREAGIRNCKEMQFQTASGTATGCIALVPHMTLGNFELQNITVAVMPNMESNLLGANVLRHFQVRQNESSMLIGRR